MKATITSTTEIVPMGGGVNARVWEGITEGGVAFTAYVTLCQVRTDADNSEFERELAEHKQPETETVRAIDARFII